MRGWGSMFIAFVVYSFIILIVLGGGFVLGVRVMAWIMEQGDIAKAVLVPAFFAVFLGGAATLVTWLDKRSKM